MLTSERRGAAVLAAAVATSLGAALPNASAVPAGDEPGVTMRAFQLGRPISELCTLKAGQRRPAQASHRLGRARRLQRSPGRLRRRAVDCEGRVVLRTPRRVKAVLVVRFEDGSTQRVSVRLTR